MKYLVLLLFKATHIWDWLKRLFGGPALWKPDLSLILPNFYLGGFFEEWPRVDCVVNLAEENKYKAPLGKCQLDIGRADLPPAQTPQQLQAVVNLVTAWLREGLTVAVVCDLGNNRSATDAIAVVMVLLHLTADQAIAYVRSERPSVGPHAWQINALKAFEASLRGVSFPSTEGSV